MSAEQGFVRRVACATAAALLLSGPASAELLDIRNFQGFIEIREGDALGYEIEGGERSAKVSGEFKDGVLAILGEAPEKALRRGNLPEAETAADAESLSRYFEAEGFPTLTLTAPKGTSFWMERSAAIVNAETLGGDVSADDSLIFGAFGDARYVDIDLHGTSAIEIGHIERELRLDLHGAGELMARSAPVAVLRIDGQGDAKIYEVTERLRAKIEGAGHVHVAHAKGVMDVLLSGAGGVMVSEADLDEVVANVDGGGHVMVMGVSRRANVNVGGSGGVTLQEIRGDIAVRIDGSGNVVVDHGRAEVLKAALNGAGNFRFGGVVLNPEIESSGSGKVSIGARAYREDYGFWGPPQSGMKPLGGKQDKRR